MMKTVTMKKRVAGAREGNTALLENMLKAIDGGRIVPADYVRLYVQTVLGKGRVVSYRRFTGRQRRVLASIKAGL